ncbi:hypothetical protein ACEPT7_09215 [Burkholderia ubonensis]|uniref:hypothetical protein n=1 Tax=Burkholderia ubonensis TaxID=101571 RepID=UPI00358EBA87
MSLSENLIASGVDCTLLRGMTSVQLSKLEHRRPRIATGAEFLFGTLNDGLSLHTRTRCAFESAYLCCCELAEVSGLSSERVEHPSMVIVTAAMPMLGLTETDGATLRTLTEWASSNSPFLPQLKPEGACMLARDVVVRTIQYLA